MGSLRDYLKRRDFGKTPEPQGRGKGRDDKPAFVIQKHAASTLHYDFRLEIDDVLASWAVPKGPSTDPRDKRLAVRTEDHPLDYATFEGVIPEGEYGAGTVIVWDAGPYRNLLAEKDEPRTMAEGVKEGHLEVRLEGKKLSGGYALIRTDTEPKEKWLLVKMDDEAADARRNPVSTEPKSVLSGRSLEEVEREEA